MLTGKPIVVKGLLLYKWVSVSRPANPFLKERPIAAVAIASGGRRVVLASSRTLRVLDLGGGKTLHILGATRTA
jgi:hypothetical protein